jgi:hypothetical protein
MKKTKRSLERDERELDSSVDMRIGFDDLENDEEVIELEDVVEIPEEDDEDLELDVDFLDADAEYEMDGLEVKLTSSGESEILDEETLKDFSFPSEKHDPRSAQSKKSLFSEEPEDLEEDLEAELLIDPSLKDDSRDVFEEDLDLWSLREEKEEKDVFESLAFDEDRLESFKEEKGFERDIFKELGLIDETEGEKTRKDEAALPPVSALKEPDLRPSEDEALEQKAPQKIVDEVEAVTVESVPAPESRLSEDTSSTDVNAALDAFVAQIEVRLVEVVRETVEARLPDIVRAVIREEIERMREEGEAGGEKTKGVVS